MEKATVWYLTDNDQGKKHAESIKRLGLTLNLISGSDLSNANIIANEINFFVIDLIKEKPEKLIKNISKSQRLNSFLKFVILTKKEIKLISKLSFNILHMEYISRPVEIREFLLLLEKSIIVERYREIMKFISREAEFRIETYEGLLDINRKNIFESEGEKEAFEKIIDYEKGLMREQDRLNKVINDFMLLRYGDMFDVRGRVRADEMLSDLRKRELLEEGNTAGVQEPAVDYFFEESGNTNEILDVTSGYEAESGLNSAVDLNKELEREKELNRSLSEEIEKLLQEVESLRAQQNG